MQLIDLDFNFGFDAVVMLTISDWKTEPRSNRYHYATRFAKQCRVVFVQPDLADGYIFEPSGQEGVELLHVPCDFGKKQSACIAEALTERRILRPLLWIYSPNYIDTVERLYAPLRVLHATEDIFSTELRRQQLPNFYERLSHLFSRLDLVVAVSSGVLDSYRLRGGYRGKALLLENGCDYKLIREVVGGISSENQIDAAPRAFYQGGINYRLDFPMLFELARSMTAWEFEFCGRVHEPGPIWDELLSLPNVRYLGELAHEEVMVRAASATVGLMPFCKTPFIQKISLPLKAFEYAACGLPVVGVAIDSLSRWPTQFLVAADVESFRSQMEHARASCRDEAAVQERLAIASQQDYDARFSVLQEELSRLATCCDVSTSASKLNVLVLYGSVSTFTSTVHEYVSSIGRFSNHHVFFADAVRDAPANFDMSHFDVIVVNYSVRLTLDDYIAPDIVRGMKASGAFRILTIQDEYDNVERTRQWMDEIGFHVVLTCIPNGQAGRVYPRKRFPGTEFIPVLTGYVPLALERHCTWQPLEDRPITLGYRGRRLPFIYGRFAQEKYEIGRCMRELSEQRGIISDIEWNEEKRIYGDDWYRFIGDCRAMLGSESGSNVFDFDGTLQQRADALIATKPDISFEEFEELLLKDIEGVVIMNQISARVFEAIALGTPLILFEGAYSDAIRPHEHYIPLKKDYSNVDEVFRALNDLDALEAMAQRAYRDVIASGKFSYRTFVNAIDALINQRVRTEKPWQILSLGVGSVRTDRHNDHELGNGAVPKGSLVTWPVGYHRFDSVLEPLSYFPVESLGKTAISWKVATVIHVRRVGRGVLRRLPPPLREITRRSLIRIARAVRLID